uniref:Tetraspanin n=1 Tax=Lepisosteus oculatus TaxID=7918 RepID=W5MX74_LEPOC
TSTLRGVKCLAFLNFLFVSVTQLSGSLVLAIGLWLRFDSNTTSIFELENSPYSYYVGVYILIGAGGLMMLVGFFGCCGAVRESQCLLGSFFACLLVIFAAEIAAGVFGFMNKNKIIEEIKSVYTAAANDNQSDNSTLIVFHEALQCCGTIEKKTQMCSSESESKLKDCPTEIENFFNAKLYIIGYVGIGIAGVMIIGMVFSMVLCCAIRNSREVI